MLTKLLVALLWGSYLTNADLLGIPTVPFKEHGDSFSLSSLSAITVDAAYCESTDTNGQTLIPPTLLDFANTFASDLEETDYHATVNTGDHSKHNGIFVTIGNSTSFVDAAGRWTSEAYSLNVTSNSITITGASPLGAWWATRSVLQQAAVNNGSVPGGYGVDAPGWGTRGIMVSSIRALAVARTPLKQQLTKPARLRPSLLPARVHSRALYVAILLEEQRVSHPPVRQPL